MALPIFSPRNLLCEAVGIIIYCWLTGGAAEIAPRRAWSGAVLFSRPPP